MVPLPLTDLSSPEGPPAIQDLTAYRTGRQGSMHLTHAVLAEAQEEQGQDYGHGYSCTHHPHSHEQDHVGGGSLVPQNGRGCCAYIVLTLLNELKPVYEHTWLSVTESLAVERKPQDHLIEPLEKEVVVGRVFWRGLQLGQVEYHPFKAYPRGVYSTGSGLRILDAVQELLVAFSDGIRSLREEATGQLEFPGQLLSIVLSRDRRDENQEEKGRGDPGPSRCSSSFELHLHRAVKGPNTL